MFALYSFTLTSIILFVDTKIKWIEWFGSNKPEAGEVAELSFLSGGLEKIILMIIPSQSRYIKSLENL